MEARAIQKQIGVPATKVRLIIDLIRGKPVEEALTILQFSTRPVARVVEKTLRSAIANAVNRDEESTVDAEDLIVSRIFADEGRDLKRMRPRARGASDRIRKRHSHLTVFVDDGSEDAGTGVREVEEVQDPETDTENADSQE